METQTTLPGIETPYLLDFLVGLLNTPSPTGWAESGIAYTGEALMAFPELKLTRTLKGALLATLPGQSVGEGSPQAERALTGHVDTLGAMVKEIKSNGRLKLTTIGGVTWNTVEGEGCTVYASNGKRARGSILINKASAHVYGRQLEESKRDADNMEVRLDERTINSAETQALGIQVGDFVVFDPRVEVVNGFIRSRHLDDKAAVACMVAALKALHDAGLAPRQTTHFLFSNYEEVGHGAASGIPTEVTELVAVDMAAVGDGQASTEFCSSLCVKDSGGVYHMGLSQRLRQLAEHYKIAYKVDIYPYYGSDAESYWRAGGTGRIALIGPGVDASHNYERTHMEALVATTQWILAYVLNE